MTRIDEFTERQILGQLMALSKNPDSTPGELLLKIIELAHVQQVDRAGMFFMLGTGLCMELEQRVARLERQIAEMQTK